MDSNGLVTRGCGFEPRLRQELSTTDVRPLSKAPNPRLLQVCVHLDGLKAETHFTAGYTLYNCVCEKKAHLSLNNNKIK